MGKSIDSNNAHLVCAYQRSSRTHYCCKQARLCSHYQQIIRGPSTFHIEPMRVVDYALKSSFARTLTLWAGECSGAAPIQYTSFYNSYIIYKELVVRLRHFVLALPLRAFTAAQPLIINYNSLITGAHNSHTATDGQRD